MGPGEVLPGADPPVRVEMVHQSVRTRVNRLFFPGQTVIRKESLGPDAERRVRRETAMLERKRAQSLSVPDPGSGLPVPS